jgi:hypothetical protein
MNGMTGVLNRRLTAGLMSLTLAAGLLAFTATANAVPPDLFATITQPVGVAATQNEVLVTQPYCVHDSQTGALSPSQWQVVRIDTAGVQTLFATIPADPNYVVRFNLSNCTENYIVVTPGTVGGFRSGHAFVAQGGFIYEFDSTGTLVPNGANNFLASIPSLEVPFAHTSITLDTTGTFGNKLIVTGTDSSNFGEVWSVDLAGNTVQLLTFTGPGGSPVCDGPAGGPCFEGPQVAPLVGPVGSFFPGDIFAALPGLSGIGPDVGVISPALSISAPNGSGLPAVPEHVDFVPDAPCGFNFKPAGTAGTVYQFFNASFSASGAGPLGNTIYAYKATDFLGLAGQMLMVTEGGSPGIAITNGVTPSMLNFTSFDPAIYNSEGSSFVTCVATCDCPSGQKKRHEDDQDEEANNGCTDEFENPDKPEFEDHWCDINQGGDDGEHHHHHNHHDEGDHHHHEGDD